MNPPLSIVEQLKVLERLQELDLKIDSLKRDQNSLPATLKAIDDSLNKVKTIVETKKNQLIETEKTYKQAQAALDLNQDRLARSNSKLEGVQNSQEFQAANKEIEQLKKLNISLEEQSKKAKQDLEQLKVELTTHQAQLEKIQGERTSQAEVLSGQDQRFKADISTLVADRSQFSDKIEARILSQYDRIRAARGGLGVVPAVGGRCKGCNMVVPPQLYNEIQRGSALHSCPSCHRLLFTTPPSSSNSEAGSSSTTNRIA